MFSTSVACLSLEQIFRLLYSTAFAVAVQQNTRSKWVEYRDSKVLNFIYSAMPWKGGPGWIEVEQNWREIECRKRKIFLDHVEVFLRKLELGPGSVVDYLIRMEELRDQAQKGWMDVFIEAGELNRGIIDETGLGISRLAKIKAASTIAVALLSGGTTVFVGGVTASYASAVNLGYSLTASIAKNLAEAKGAKALAIDVGKELVKEKANKGAEGGAKMLTSIGFWTFVNESGKWDVAVQKVQRLSADLARKTSSAKIAKIGRKVANAQAEVARSGTGMVKGIQLTRAGQMLSVAVPVVFAGLDILLAIKEYTEDTDGL